ncbi:DUF2807 domain-containing protein [Undibacterium piscinae]|uniref:DUF2807 domain-containing protein n=1 Tax=Undibacterium piscinae TaxID=2495591 RepID=A0A6M4A822_9BURK|nr:DUF2807 domain-containing protein [Undibacterium piscinae]
MKTILRTGLGMLILAVVLTAASTLLMRAYAATGAVTGAVTGNTSALVSSESRPLETGIVNVVLSGPIDLELKRGDTPHMLIKGDANMLPRVTSRVEGNTLYLGTRGIIVLIRQPLKVELSLPALEKLQTQGSGDSQVSGFHGSRLELSVTGSGDLGFDGNYQQVQARSSGSADIALNFTQLDSLELVLQGSGDARLKGQAKVLNLKLSGSGDLYASAMKAKQVSVFSSGSSEVQVFAEQAITVRALGSGNTTIYGKPAKRMIERSGSGEISWQ